MDKKLTKRKTMYKIKIQEYKEISKEVTYEQN